MLRWLTKWKLPLLLAALAILMFCVMYGAIADDGWFDRHIEIALRYLGDRASATAISGGVGVFLGIASLYFWFKIRTEPEVVAEPNFSYRSPVSVRWQ